VRRFTGERIWKAAGSKTYSEIELKGMRKTTENSGQPNDTRKICKEVMYCPVLKYYPD
jgi:hypothetical protein